MEKLMFFFQCLCRINKHSCLCSPLLQLALSPSPRTPSEPIPVQNTQQLTLKVEGVVQHGSTPGLFRKVQSVCLNVTSVLQSKTGPDYKVQQIHTVGIQDGTAKPKTRTEIQMFDYSGLYEKPSEEMRNRFHISLSQLLIMMCTSTVPLPH